MLPNMVFDAAQLAVLIGLANGVVLLLKPIARVHQRIDRNERDLWELKGKVSDMRHDLEGVDKEHG